MEKSILMNTLAATFKSVLNCIDAKEGLITPLKETNLIIRRKVQDSKNKKERKVF